MPEQQQLSPPEAAAGLLPAGTRVSVRSTYSGQWSRGFEIASAVIDADAAPRPLGYRLRRLSDGAVLPAIFPAEDLTTLRR